MGLLRATAATIVLTLLATDTLAQINSPGARTLFARSFLYRSGWRARDREFVWESTLVYGVARNWMAVAVVPVSRSSGSTSVGDPLLLAQYDGLYQKNRAGGFTRLAGFFGVRTSLSSEPPSFVPGLVFTHATARWFLSGDFQWTARNDVSDLLQADASVMYRLLAFPERNDLFLVLELNSAREREGGRNSAFLSPGVELFLKPNVALELSAQIPLHENGDPVWVTGIRLFR